MTELQRKNHEFPERLAPEHNKRFLDNSIHPDVLAAHNYVESVLDTSDYVGRLIWHGWALREAFLAGISHAESKT